MNEPKTITLGELRQELAGCPDDAKIFFGYGDLAFSRVKNHGPVDPKEGILLQVEFNEIHRVAHEWTHLWSPSR
ncbi:MAG: hypothetical protein LBF93_03610 [Zoogloeaceae bacterium]|nr:hypothetical protein [Zoogloeaceae bacterium]